MKPEIAAFFQHISKEKPFAALGDASTYLETLSPTQLKAFLGEKVSSLDENLVFERVKNAVGKLIFKHGSFYPINQYIMPELEAVSQISKKAYFRIIGDVHQKQDKYARIALEAEYSLQVGDMGFDYSYLDAYLDPDKHKVLAGNHDNYNTQKCCESGCEKCEGRGYIFCDQTKHFLKDFGVLEIPRMHPIFYVRGAWSIDFLYRTPGISWWEDEELTMAQCEKAISLYKEVKPDFVVTHSTPLSVASCIPFKSSFGTDLHKTRTDQMLDAMYDAHQPAFWIFGHYHLDWRKDLSNNGRETTFICLNELSYKDFPAIG